MQLQKLNNHEKKKVVRLISTARNFLDAPSAETSPIDKSLASSFSPSRLKNYAAMRRNTSSVSLFSTSSPTLNRINKDLIDNKNRIDGSEKQAMKKNPEISLNELRSQIIHSALSKYVHQYGWTQDTISIAAQEIISNHSQEEGKNSEKGAMSLLPPGVDYNISTSISGLVTPCDLIEHCMDQWNARLRQELINFSNTGNSYHEQEEFLTYAIKSRLEYSVPYIRSKQWTNGMALGLKNPLRTQSQLKEMIHIITTAEQNQNNDSVKIPLMVINPYHVMICSIFVATELHLLTDASDNFEDTWTFLKQHIENIKILRANFSTPNNIIGSMRNDNNIMFTISSVVSSFASGFVSLLSPPQSFTMQRQQQNQSTSPMDSSWLSMYGIPDNMKFMVDIIMQSNISSAANGATKNTMNRSFSSSADGGIVTSNKSNNFLNHGINEQKTSIYASNRDNNGSRPSHY